MTDKDEHPSEWLHEYVSFEVTPDGPQGRTQQIQVNPGRVAYLRQERDRTTTLVLEKGLWLHVAEAPHEVRAHLLEMGHQGHFRR